jgi:hypothetical protein
MRTVAILGQVIALAVACSGSQATAAAAAAAPAVGTGEEAPSWYTDQFGQEEARVARTPATADDAEFATKLLAWAGKLEGDPKAKAFLCEKAYTFGLKNAAGCPTAIQALEMLRTCTTGRDAELDAKRLDACETWLKLERGPQREAAAVRLVRLLTDTAEKAVAAGEFDRAVEAYRRASQAALAVKLPQAKDIAARIKVLADASHARKEVANVEKAFQGQPNNRSLATRLVMLYLVEMDDPAKAAGLLGKADAAEAVRTYAPLAAKGAEAATEQLAGELGDWYAALAAKAEGYAKYLMLRHARAYYERFLALHEKQDVGHLRVTTALAKVDKELKPLLPPNAPVDLLAAIDIKRDAPRGQWRQTPKGLWAKGDKYAMIVLPAPGGPNYELTVRFTRMVGNDTQGVTFPVGTQRCCLILDGWNGAASGLHAVAGKEASGNETTAKGTLITNGKENTLRLVVKTLPQDIADITVDFNGKKLIAWKGPQVALTAGHGQFRPDRNDALALGVDSGETIFHSVRLVLLP